MKTAEIKIVGVGQCALDHLAIVERYPANDDKAEILEWDTQGGGPVATALVTAAKLGAGSGAASVRTAFHGVVGSDPEGAQIRSTFEDASSAGAGMDVSGLVVRPNVTSQVAFIVAERGTGKRTIFWRRPRIAGNTGSERSSELQPHELPADFLKNASLLILDGLMKDVSLEAAKRARAAGVPVLLDAGRMREGTHELIQYTDYLVASEIFARQVGWQADLNPTEAARFLPRALEFGSKVVTLTFGAYGSVTFLRDSATYFLTPSFPVKAVDTTGAGDVFHGAYAYGVVQGWALAEIVRFASAVAAMKCRSLGGRAGIPNLNEVRDFLR